MKIYTPRNIVKMLFFYFEPSDLNKTARTELLSHTGLHRVATDSLMKRGVNILKVVVSVEILIKMYQREKYTTFFERT